MILNPSTFRSTTMAAFSLVDAIALSLLFSTSSVSPSKYLVYISLGSRTYSCSPGQGYYPWGV